MNNIPAEIKFNVSEIFYSVQGESTLVGLPCVFVRMQGCELRCKWCDTPYALEIKQTGQIMTAGEILEEIEKYHCNYVTFTGGEPLLQQDIHKLINYLAASGYKVAVETNGHQDISSLNSNVIKIMDLKPPASGMEKFNNFDNLEYMSSKDEIKIVINDRNDYIWACDIITKYDLDKIVKSIILMPVFGELPASTLAEWILSDRLPVRMLLQLHKFIWSANKRGV